MESEETEVLKVHPIIIKNVLYKVTVQTPGGLIPITHKMGEKENTHFIMILNYFFWRVKESTWANTQTMCPRIYRCALTFIYPTSHK